MRAFPRLLVFTFLLGVITFSGCNRNGSGGLGGNSSATGDSADQDSQRQPQQKKQGGEPTNTEPQGSVSGRPSAESDRGSSDAVAHRSVAQPGAPQGTTREMTPDTPSKPASKAPAPRH
jgi:hypothetical protein